MFEKETLKKVGIGLGMGVAAGVAAPLVANADFRLEELLLDPWGLEFKHPLEM